MLGFHQGELMPKLSVYKNRNHLFNYFIETDDIVIGRSQDADVPLDSDAVSRQHLRIKKEGASYVAEDLSGKNGMFINNQYTNIHLLRDGDKIEIAQHLIVFHRSDTELAEEEIKQRPGHQYYIDRSHVEKILDTTSGRVEDTAQAVDSDKATTLLSAQEIHKLKVATARRRGAHLAYIHQGLRKEIPLGTSANTIGWAEDCDLRLPGKPLLFGGAVARISPTHDGSYQLEALNFWRPVKVGGTRVQVHALQDDDLVEVGGLKIRFRSAVD
jgi:hypothetical protein